jgi:hypothetical protein
LRFSLDHFGFRFGFTFLFNLFRFFLGEPLAGIFLSKVPADTTVIDEKLDVDIPNLLKEDGEIEYRKGIFVFPL